MFFQGIGFPDQGKATHGPPDSMGVTIVKVMFVWRQGRKQETTASLDVQSKSLVGGSRTDSGQGACMKHCQSPLRFPLGRFRPK